MCKLGGIVLLHTKKGWVVREWKNGKAPEHEHFSWDMQKWALGKEKTHSIYPQLKNFAIGEGILIGGRHDMNMFSILPYHLLDGIVLMKIVPKRRRQTYFSTATMAC